MADWRDSQLLLWRETDRTGTHILTIPCRMHTCKTECPEPSQAQRSGSDALTLEVGAHLLVARGRRLERRRLLAAVVLQLADAVRVDALAVVPLLRLLLRLELDAVLLGGALAPADGEAERRIILQRLEEVRADEALDELLELALDTAAERGADGEARLQVVGVADLLAEAVRHLLAVPMPAAY